MAIPPTAEVLTSTGLRIEVRSVSRDDRASLLEGFERLSPSSRYLRFFTAMPRLGGAALEGLLGIDQLDHLAVGAFDPAIDGEHPHGVGVARVIRDPARGDRGQFAVAVTDDYQRQGVGRVLLIAIGALANEAGITQMSGDILASNRAMSGLLTSLGGTISIDPSDRSVIIGTIATSALAALNPDDG